MKVLYIEPDRLLAKSVSDYLQSFGHRVEWCTDAQNAINAADKSMPDIIIMELLLAGHSGIEFLYELRSYSEWQAIPVIVFTVLPPESAGLDNPAWQQAGLAAYHYKPRSSLAALRRSLDKAAAIVSA